MSVKIIINGESAVEAACELRAFLNALAPAGVSGATEEKPKKTAKAAPAADEDEPVEQKKPVAKKAAKAVPADDEDEDDVPVKAKVKPKAKVKAAPADDEDEDEDEAPAPKAKAKPEAKPAASSELKDDGKDQPATVDGCRIMVRRVAHAHDTDYAQAVLAEFGVEGATKIPEKKMQAFIDRCQEVIDDPESIELEA